MVKEPVRCPCVPPVALHGVSTHPGKRDEQEAYPSRTLTLLERPLARFLLLWNDWLGGTRLVCALKRTDWRNNHNVDQFLRFVVRAVGEGFRDGEALVEPVLCVFITDPVIDLLHGLGFKICPLEVDCL